MGEPDAVAIVLAAGVGRRLGGELPKAFLTIGGKPLLSIAAAAAAASPWIESILIATRPGFEVQAADLVRHLDVPVRAITGGRTRQASVNSALSSLLAFETPPELVAVHDAARPFASPDLFSTVLEALEDADGAIPLLPIADTVKRVRDGFVRSTESRDELGLAQTPQAFRFAALRDAHERAVAASVDLTDDAAVMEWAGYRVRAVPGEPGNFKITTLGDLARAEARMAGEAHG